MGLDIILIMSYNSLKCGYGVVATQEFSKLLSSVQIRVSASPQISGELNKHRSCIS